MNNKIFKLSALLFLVCVVVAGVLGTVYEFTRSRIEEQNRIKTESAFRAVLASDSYEAVEYSGSDETIDSISRCKEGYVLTTTFGGCQGDITMVVGVSNELYCTGISIISHKETSGLGEIAAKKSAAGENWRAQFVGKGEDMFVSKKGESIEAISGATITSKAVAKAAANCISLVKELQ